jgi:uncharacterized protein (TIGR02117 family)
MRWRVLVAGVAAAIALLLAATVLTARSSDPVLWPPQAGARTVEVHVVSHGYHSGIVAPRAVMAEVAQQRNLAALVAVAGRFAAYPWLEFGWGDEEFYRSVPDVGSLSISLALRALFVPGNKSALHAVGLARPVREAFPSSEIVRLALSEDGFARLLEQLDATVARNSAGVPEELSPGLYGPSLFYRAVGDFHVFNLCNHWVARLLSAAGVPTAPVPATLPRGLFLDLKWRAGLVPLKI